MTYNNNNNQQQQRRFSPCFRKCGIDVTYDEAHKSKSGKHIPLVIETDSLGQEKLVPHNCPLWKKAGGDQKQQPQEKEEQQIHAQTRGEGDDMEMKVLMRLAVENKDSIRQILLKLNSIEAQIAAK